jgi:hypothetical protein
MRSVQDAIYNWLTIKAMSDARPEDKAARETYDLFNDMLQSDHGIRKVTVERLDDMYLVTYETEEQTKTARFPLELIDCFLDQMNREPEKYKNYDI